MTKLSEAQIMTLKYAENFSSKQCFFVCKEAPFTVCELLVKKGLLKYEGTLYGNSMYMISDEGKDWLVANSEQATAPIAPKPTPALEVPADHPLRPVFERAAQKTEQQRLDDLAANALIEYFEQHEAMQKTNAPIDVYRENAQVKVANEAAKGTLYAAIRHAMRRYTNTGEIANATEKFSHYNFDRGLVFEYVDYCETLKSQLGRLPTDSEIDAWANDPTLTPLASVIDYAEGK